MTLQIMVVFIHRAHLTAVIAALFNHGRGKVRLAYDEAAVYVGDL
jgi:hypothetical protein